MPKLARRLLGVTLILLGIPIFVLPIPFGIVLIAIGAAMVMGNDVNSIVEIVREQKAKRPSFGRMMNWTQRISPAFIQRWLGQYE